MEEIKLPELGENIETVDVSAVLVAVGDSIRRDQPVVEVETEKASLEVPSTCDGRVEEILVEVGARVQVGQVLVRVRPGAAAAKAESEPAAQDEASPAVADARAAPRREPPVPSRPAPAPSTAGTEEAPLIEFPAPAAEAPAPARETTMVAAAPSTRALARELGVDITRVAGSGPGGRISRGDVKAHAKSVIQAASSGGATIAPVATTAAPLPDLARWGDVERQPLSRIRRVTAANMARSWATVPHVTQFDRADVTQLESMRKRFNRRPEAEGRKLTMTAIVVKMVAAALKQFPKFNAALDLQGGQAVYRKYVHIGVAVDTERGLLVPVIRDVDRKRLVRIAEELNDLAERARNKKVKPDEMQGAGFTVSNLGGLGTTYFAPIVNWPEVAILGVGRAETLAVHLDGRFEPRRVMPLSVSYDHRWIDGADAARFLRWLAEALEQPMLLLLDE